MALWDSGVWDTAKWSTIEATISVTLDDITFASSGQDVHVATIAVTLGDISSTASGYVTHNGSLALTTDDISTSFSGNVTRHATFALTLDDFIVSMGGTDIHVGNIAVTLDDAVFDAVGKDIHVDDFRLVLDDVAVNIDAHIVQQTVITKGGYKPKQKKIKNERAEVEKAVENAVNKALGIVEPEPIAEQPIVEKAPEIDYTAQINELMLKAQAEALGLSIEQYLIDSELDDEETILLFI